MANNLHESLSALMDNEADELELRRILKEIETLAAGKSAEEITELVELQAKWHRYHIVSASLRQEIHSKPSRNLLSAIQAELEQDAVPARSFKDTVAGRSVLRLFGQGAIAASVAVAVLFTADFALVAGNNTGDNAGSERAAQLADSDAATDQLPFTGILNPPTNTRDAIQKRLEPEEMNRLERAVSQELEEALETREVPAILNPDSDR